jgi:hypothetical protein
MLVTDAHGSPTMGHANYWSDQGTAKPEGCDAVHCTRLHSTQGASQLCSACSFTGEPSTDCDKLVGRSAPRCRVPLRTCTAYSPNSLRRRCVQRLPAARDLKAL